MGTPLGPKYIPYTYTDPLFRIMSMAWRLGLKVSGWEHKPCSPYYHLTDIIETVQLWSLGMKN